MTAVERRFVILLIALSVVALGVALAEPRTAATMVGLIFVLLVLGLTARSIDQLHDRLPDHATPVVDATWAPMTRELPQDIDFVRTMLGPLADNKPVPGAVLMRIGQIATPLIAREHHLIADDPAHREALARVVSPTMHLLLTDARQPIPMAALPGLLDELERM
jgi:hypothetical protein